MKKLERSFYLQDTITTARELLGKYLVHETGSGRRAGIIVETEAYTGVEDKACHAYEWKRTPRNEVMYGIGGTAYIYFIYGMYYCFNVVTGAEDNPCAVLIRALEPVEGLDAMAQARLGKAYEELDSSRKISLTNGPGKLCGALGITKSQNGLDLCGDELYICSGPAVPISIKATPRVNIGYAGEFTDKPWRFYLENNKYVSKK